MKFFNLTPFVLFLISLFLTVSCGKGVATKSLGKSGGSHRKGQVYPHVRSFDNDSDQVPQQGDESSDDGWISGGGYAPGPQFNPWYVKNTKSVKYCFIYSKENFGLSLSQSKKVVRYAITYWQKEFEYSRKYHHSSNIEIEDGEQFVFLATQKFIEQKSCDNESDLKIQLGVLSKEQTDRYIHIPKDYLANTVRTNYDEARLRGKGFMYFAPTQGPLKPNHGLFKEKIWQWNDSFIFKAMAIHEFGHIFGTTNSNHHIFMDSNFIYRLLSNFDPEKPVKDQERLVSPNFFTGTHIAEAPPYQVRRVCASGGATESEEVPTMTLPIVGKVRCIRFIYQSNFPGPGMPPEVSANLEVSIDGERFVPYAELRQLKGTTELVRYGDFYLPKKQEVFVSPVPDKQILRTQNFSNSKELYGMIYFQMEPQNNFNSINLNINYNNEMPVMVKINGSDSFKVLPLPWMAEGDKASWVPYFRFEGETSSNDYTAPGAHLEYLGFEAIPKSIWKPFKDSANTP
ncbi:MAG: hypothetical protein HOO06_13800 [Bdellovibrionaceae bacterium]|jgi:hypothetical protein|nr:hypothetical protein [Pseudobdellovibrionaceae bacterium]